MGWKEEEEGGMKGGWREGWIDRRRRTDRKGGGRREKGRRIKGELKEEKQGLMNRRRRQRERGSMGVGRLTRNSNVEKGRKGERERKNKREERERERERENSPQSRCQAWAPWRRTNGIKRRTNATVKENGWKERWKGERERGAADRN